jgi:hypothetical protein
MSRTIEFETDLLGAQVTVVSPGYTFRGQVGHVRGTYLDSDGVPSFIVELNDGWLVEVDATACVVGRKSLKERIAEKHQQKEK